MNGPDGKWIGYGLGDVDPKVQDMKRFLKRKFSYAAVLDDSPLYDQAMVNVVSEMQAKYGLRVTGIMNYATQVRCGYIKTAPVKPVMFTVEGHLSDMFVGPCAYTAKELENQGVVRWQPVGYDNVALPFRNQTGVNELDRLFSDTVAFPLGTPFVMAIFSQGAIVGCRFFLEQIRPENGKHHNRLKDLRGVIAFGNPYREQNVIAPWVPDPPKAGTQGISDIRMTDTPEYWREVSRTGDLYACNTADEIGLNCTAIYKIVSESSWSGGQAGMLQRVLDLLGNPFDGFIDIAIAIIRGLGFVANMGPHGTYDLGPCIDFLRQRLTN
ncbi:peptidoglycan-binding domain-containing protein [Mycolicibacterium mageritense]|uniref:Peptidoglycan binding-like domain-containing protein n=1 Tax=Mycolicibacterium mageritense TaxID=53462 RepID=A0AAI8TZK8_MYCME|nr:peptidoglycan-binding domain-containing protein [Mycolicibacterium mageritense]BDY31432.1 hypothetical protein hbim_05384 [Mycolicibacterium mageritense]